jgi:hypothetical protein
MPPIIRWYYSEVPFAKVIIINQMQIVARIKYFTLVAKLY